MDEDKANESRYEFFAPVARFEINTPGDTYVDMYVPYHLLNELRVQDLLKTYECNAYGTMDDFIHFYSVLEQCDVEADDDSIVVTSRKNGYQMKLSFYQEDNQSKVTFTIL